MKELTILLVFCNLIIFTYSGPDPEINLHVHLPPEEVKTPDIGGGKVNDTKEGTEEEALEVHHPNTETKSGPTEAPKGITSPPMKSKVVKEEKDKKTNETISFEMEGELDFEPFVSCGNHYEQRCQDCISSPNRPPATSPVLWCNGDCVWKNKGLFGECVRKSNKKQVNCGGHSADSCADCPKAGGGNRNWCNGECYVECDADSSCRSRPREWNCLPKSPTVKPPVNPPTAETGGKSGPLRIENKGGKCLFSCRKDGGCQVEWYNYIQGGYGYFFCNPKSREGGKCNPQKEAPRFCNDCHGNRARKSYAPCKEPKPEVTCDYFCSRRTCYVKWTKSIGTYWWRGTHPHWNKTVPIECKDKCLKQVPGCEFRLKL